MCEEPWCSKAVWSLLSCSPVSLAAESDTQRLSDHYATPQTLTALPQPCRKLTTTLRRGENVKLSKCCLNYNLYHLVWPPSISFRSCSQIVCVFMLCTCFCSPCKEYMLRFSPSLDASRLCGWVILFVKHTIWEHFTRDVSQNREGIDSVSAMLTELVTQLNSNVDWLNCTHA